MGAKLHISKHKNDHDFLYKSPAIANSCTVSSEYYSGAPLAFYCCCMLLVRSFRRTAAAPSNRLYRRATVRQALFPLILVTAAALLPTTSTVRGMSTTLRNGGTITVSPKNEGDQSAMVVISHGLGDTAEGLADVAEVRGVWCAASMLHRRGVVDESGLKERLIDRSVVLYVALDVFQPKYCLFCTFPAVSGQGNAVRQIRAPDRSDPTRDHEHGHGNALVVRHYRSGRALQ